MHMTKSSSANNETPNGLPFWSYCLAILTVVVLADVMTGGIVRQSITSHAVEYGVALATMIAVSGVTIKDGPPGLKFVRACSRHKL
jgi:hypothetical protein